MLWAGLTKGKEVATDLSAVNQLLPSLEISRKVMFFHVFMNFSCFFFIFLTCCQVSDVAAQQHEGPLRGKYPRIAQHNGCAPRRGSKWAIHGPPDNPSCRSRFYGKFLIKHQLFLINTCSTGRFMERLCHDSAC